MPYPDEQLKSNAPLAMMTFGLAMTSSSQMTVAAVAMRVKRMLWPSKKMPPATVTKTAWIPFLARSDLATTARRICSRGVAPMPRPQKVSAAKPNVPSKTKGCAPRSSLRRSVCHRAEITSTPLHACSWKTCSSYSSVGRKCPGQQALTLERPPLRCDERRLVVF